MGIVACLLGRNKFSHENEVPGRQIPVDPLGSSGSLWGKFLRRYGVPMRKGPR